MLISNSYAKPLAVAGSMRNWTRYSARRRQIVCELSTRAGGPTARPLAAPWLEALGKAHAAGLRLREHFKTQSASGWDGFNEPDLDVVAETERPARALANHGVNFLNVMEKFIAQA